MKDPGSHFASDDEVPLIVGFDVGENRAGAEHGRVDACGMYMFGGSTSTEVEGRDIRYGWGRGEVVDAMKEETVSKEERVRRWGR
jgi:hypothetical protein